MAASLFDSAMYGRLFPAGQVGRLFSDTAELRAMMLVEGGLAKVQGQLGTIPEISAAAIARAAVEVQLDPAALAGATGRNGVSVPAMVEAFRAAMSAPEHAQYVHWGATSQDILDSALMLRLRQALVLMEEDLRAVLVSIASLAETHAALPMPARTYGQHATPTSFGAVAAGWGAPLLDLVRELPDLRAQNLLVSLSGAAGTGAELGHPATRAALSEALGLTDPGRSWHTDRGPVLRIADWLHRVMLALGKMGEDLTELVQTGIGEVRLGGSGASSTMPQKQNPVAPSVLIALARQSGGLMSVLSGAAMHRHQRDGGAWFSEWLCLPQIVIGTAAGLATARGLVAGVQPDEGAMAAALRHGGGAIHAEALSFELARHMPRPEAQAAIKTLAAQGRETGAPMATLAAERWPDLDLTHIFDPARQLGQAPAEGRAFAAAVNALPAS